MSIVQIAHDHRGADIFHPNIHINIKQTIDLFAAILKEGCGSYTCVLAMAPHLQIYFICRSFLVLSRCVVLHIVLDILI